MRCVFRLLGTPLRLGRRLYGCFCIEINVAACLDGTLVGNMGIIVDKADRHCCRKLLRAPRLGEQFDRADRLQTYVHSCLEHAAVQHFDDRIRKDDAGVECRIRIVSFVSCQGCLCKRRDISECCLNKTCDRNFGCKGLKCQEIEIVLLKHLLRLDRRLRLCFDADLFRCDRSALLDVDRSGIEVKCRSGFNLLDTRDLDREFLVNEYI